MVNAVPVFRSFLLVLSCFMMMAAHAQEVCNNGLDDDGDGLIDLNDAADCRCEPLFGGGGSLSIIPNPSFEGFDRLPTTFGELSCASDWEQATDGTSDYFLDLPGAEWPPAVPQPVPDGIGIAAFHAIDTIIDQGLPVAYAEYLGACLLAPMQGGVEYTLRIALAGAPIGVFFDPSTTYPIAAPYGPLDITIFGSSSCPSWPVAVPPYGCPVGVGDWSELGAASYTSNGLWRTLSITFTPTTDILAVMIGPPCSIPDDYNYFVGETPVLPYFLADDLLLNRTDLFGPMVTSTGGLCTNDLVLHGNPGATVTGFQWYGNGIALGGQTDSILQVSALGLAPGIYQFRVLSADGECVVTEIAVPSPPPISTTATVEPELGCPPLAVQFEHDVPEPVASCSWDFGDGTGANICDPTHVYTSGGTYDVTISGTFTNGCTFDTTYQDMVTVFPAPTAAFTANPSATTAQATEIAFADQSSSDVTGWLWDFDTIAPFISFDPDPLVSFPAAPGDYPVMLVVTNAAGCTDTLRSFIRIERTGELQLPNVFTPNGDGVNDRFLPMQAFEGRWRLTIYNRWGLEVYSTTSVAGGWSGAGVSEGTYFWTLEAMEGQVVPRRSGHITLLRER